MRTPENLRAMDDAREILYRLRDNPAFHIVEIVEAIFYGPWWWQQALSHELIFAWRRFDHDDHTPRVEWKLDAREEAIARAMELGSGLPLPHGVRLPCVITARFDLVGPRCPIASGPERLVKRCSIGATLRRNKGDSDDVKVVVDAPSRENEAAFVEWLDAATSRLDEIEAPYGSVKHRLPQSVRGKLSKTCCAIFDILAADGPMIGDEIANKLRKMGIVTGADAKSLSQRGIRDLNEAIESEGFKVQNARGKGYYIEKIPRGVGAEKSRRR